MKGGGGLTGPRPRLGRSLLFMAVIIVFFVFDYPYMVEVVGYSPVLRYSTDNKVPTIHDPNLEVEEVAQGLELPTSIAFLEKAQPRWGPRHGDLEAHVFRKSRK